MTQLTKQTFIKKASSFFYENLPYILLTIHTLLLVIPCFWFTDDFNIAHVRSFDDWYLSTCLRRTSLAFKDGNMLNFVMGLFDISYGPLFWFLLFLITYPFLLLNSEPGILITGHLLSLVTGACAWLVVIILIKQHITKKPLIISLALLPGLLIPQVLIFQSSIHPDMLAMLAITLMIYFLMLDREKTIPFSNYFNYALIALCIGFAIKFNSAISAFALILHTFFNRKSYSLTLFKKHVILAGGLTFLFHMPMIHYDVFKHYIARLLFLSKKARELGGWQNHLITIQEKIAAFNDCFFSIWFFIFISLIGLIFLFLNRKKWHHRNNVFLFFLGIFFFISHCSWVLVSNHVIWVHYALIGAFLLPIIIAFIATQLEITFYQHPKKTLFLSFFFLLPIISEMFALSKKSITFAKTSTEPCRIEMIQLFKKINSIMASTKHRYIVVAATPPLGLSPYSTTQVPEIINVRTSYHFKRVRDFGDFNEDKIEALIFTTGFKLHDMPTVDAIEFINQQPYAILYQQYHTDDKITIFIRRDIIEKIK